MATATVSLTAAVAPGASLRVAGETAAGVARVSRTPRTSPGGLSAAALDDGRRRLSLEKRCSTSGSRLGGKFGADRLAGRSGPVGRTSRSTRLVSSRVVEKVVGPVEGENEASDLPSEEQLGQQIWLSDVVEVKKRPYFFDREWSKKDLIYLAYMSVVHGACLLAPFTFSWDAFGVFAVLYVITGMFGITLSYHRNLSHKSFKLPKWLEYVFAYCGVLAIQGDPIEWVSAHRYHHQHCDTPMDPHTPYEGFWHSHMGWLLDSVATEERVASRANAQDMTKDPFYIFIEKTYPLHIIGMAALLFAIGGLPYVIWGVAVRAVWVYHITWAVNSASHVWGYQSWNTGDLSRNNWWVALLAFGEGWHNNHHAFEYSARHGLDWWQFDMTWYTILLLEKMGLASKVKYPTKEHKARLSFQKS